MAKRFSAVSYTHLDVYKRQVKPPPDKNNSKRAKVETIGRSQESINRASKFL